MAVPLARNSLRLALVAALLSVATRGLSAEMTTEEHRRLRAICFRLGENQPGKKWDAARELIAEGPRAVPVVAELLGGEWVEGKRMAAWILDQIHDPAAVSPLSRALDDPDYEVRWKAAVGLKRIGKPATVHLIAMLLAGTLPAKQCAAWSLGEIGDPDGSGALASALEEDDEDLRWKAAIALTQVGAPSLPALAQVLKNQKVETRRCAVWAVGQIGGTAALPALEQALSDKDNLVRAKAVVALANIRDEAATQLLLRMVTDTDPVVRKDAIVALGRRGKTLTPTERPDKVAGELAGEIPRYGLCEVPFRPAKPVALANPFADATVTATFIAPDDRNIKVAGFYAGDGTWRVRTILDQVGLWYFRIDFKAGDATEVGHGGVKCVESDATGLLRIAEDNPRFFVFADKSRFYPIGCGSETLGSPGPDGVPANTPVAWRAYLDDCAKAGMNYCRILLVEVPWVPRDAVRAHPELSPWPLSPDGAAYDLARFSLPFWDKLDAVIAHGAKRGLVFELTVFDETGLAAGGKNPWTLHPFNRANGGPLAGLAGSPACYDLAIEPNRAAQEAYVRYLLARTAACANVTYELNNAMNRNGSARRLGVRWAEHWAAFFREHDPFDHLVALSVEEEPESYFRIQGIDVANVHGSTPPEPHGIRMPVLLDEPYAKTPREERSLFWRCLLVGSATARAPWQGLAARTTAFEHCRYLADFARTVRYWELRRDDSIVLAVPGGVTPFTSVRKDEVISYLTGAAADGAVRVGLAKGRYEASWFDPKNGVVRRKEEVEPAGGVAELTCPTFEEDIVLRIVRK